MLQGTLEKLMKGSGGLFEEKPVSPAPLFSEANALEARRAKAWLEDRLKKASKLAEDDLISEVASVTPAMAEVILGQCNLGNRPIRERRIAHWTRTITEGRMMLLSQGISFSREGSLNNGQHRLLAIIRAGRSVKMNVTFGESRDAFMVLDTGAGRSGGDVLHTLGYKNTNQLAASARLYELVTNYTPSNSGRFQLSNDEVAEIIRQNPKLEDVTTAGHTIGNKLKASTSALTTAFYIIQQKSDSARRLDGFIERLSSGAELKQSDPILVLREALRNHTLEIRRDGSGKQVQICAGVIMAWNLWVKGLKARPSKLLWLAGTPFPNPE